jgi:hypothetical protein
MVGQNVEIHRYVPVTVQYKQMKWESITDYILHCEASPYHQMVHNKASDPVPISFDIKIDSFLNEARQEEIKCLITRIEICSKTMMMFQMKIGQSHKLQVYL